MICRFFPDLKGGPAWMILENSRKRGGGPRGRLLSMKGTGGLCGGDGGLGR